MATDNQIRQRKLYMMKGQIAVMKATAKILSTNDEFSARYQGKLKLINSLCEDLYVSFNKEVGWE